MARSKQPPPAGSSGEPGQESDAAGGFQNLTGLLPREELDRLSTLQILDLIASRVPARDAVMLDLVYLRDRIAGLEEVNDQARQALEKFDAIVEKLRAPAFRVGTFLGMADRDLALVCLNGTDYV